MPRPALFPHYGLSVGRFPVLLRGMWPFFLARKQLFPPGKFPVFACVSILGVALGVTALLVVQTVMNSFGEEHRQRIRDAFGDVIVYSHHNTPFPVSLVNSLEKMPEVRAAAAYAEGGAVVLGEKKMNFNLVRGIDPSREDKVTPVTKYLTPESSWDDFDDEHIILGYKLAFQLGVGIGDRVTLQSPQKIQQFLEQNRAVQPKELVVCGLVNAGFKDVDERLMLVTLRAARDLFDVPDGTAAMLHVKLHDHRRATPFVEKLQSEPNAVAVASSVWPDTLRIRPWFEFKKEFLDAVAMEKQMLFFLMFIITLVASFSIGSTMFSHVVRRTREIGLLGALGARPPQILRIFVAQGLFIGVAGYTLGAILAFLILWQRQQIVSLLGADDTLSAQYLFSKVPLHYNPGDFVVTAALTIILITLVSFAPALWAARRKPSEAMRDAN